MDKLVEPAPKPAAEAPLPAPPEERGRPVLRYLGYTFLGLAFLLLFYGAVAYFGWRAGEADRAAAITADLEATIDRQLELAEAEIGSGNFNIALRRITFVLNTDPDHAAALDLRQRALDGQALLLTPTVTPTPPPTITATPPPTPTLFPDNTRAARDEFEKLEALVEEGAWAEAVEAIEAYRLAYPDYRRRDVSEMLYDSYVNLGLTLTRGVEIERGISYLQRAAELGDLSEEVLGEIFWAEQYLEGIVFYGIDWPTYLSYFRPMCEFAPLYQNSCGRLADGLLAFAEQETLNQEWCPTEMLYREALRTGEVRLSEIEAQLAAAADLCLNATPTPEFDLTETPEFDGGQVVTSSFGIENNGFIPPAVAPTPGP